MVQFPTTTIQVCRAKFYLTPNPNSLRLIIDSLRINLTRLCLSLLSNNSFSTTKEITPSVICHCHIRQSQVATRVSQTSATSPRKLSQIATRTLEGTRYPRITRRSWVPWTTAVIAPSWGRIINRFNFKINKLVKKVKF
jgi:hypothetical protein